MQSKKFYFPPKTDVLNLQIEGVLANSEPEPFLHGPIG